MGRRTLSGPSQTMFLLSLALAVLGVIGAFTAAVPFATANAFWLVLGGYAVLAIACVARGT